LKSTYYHYCSVDAGTAQALQSAGSKRQFLRVAHPWHGQPWALRLPDPSHSEQVQALDAERSCWCPDLPAEQLSQAHIVKADDVVAKLALDRGLGGLPLFRV
jgi:hypothetical protein